MTIEEFIEQRAKELCSFFRGKYGKLWRLEIRRHAGPGNRPPWLQPKITSRCGVARFDRYTPCLARVEAFARACGWKPSAEGEHAPFERNSVEKVRRTIHTLHCQVLSSDLRRHLTLERVVLHWNKHNYRPWKYKSGLIPLHLLEFEAPEERIPSPLRCPEPAISIRSLLAREVVPPAQAGHPTGGRPTPVAPLDPSRAELDPPRARLLPVETTAQVTAQATAQPDYEI